MNFSEHPKISQNSQKTQNTQKTVRIN